MTNGVTSFAAGVVPEVFRATVSTPEILEAVVILFLFCAASAYAALHS